MYQWTRADTVLENSLRIYRRKRGTSGLCFHSLGVPLRHKDSILIPSLVLQVGGTQKNVTGALSSAFGLLTAPLPYGLFLLLLLPGMFAAARVSLPLS